MHLYIMEGTRVRDLQVSCLFLNKINLSIYLKTKSLCLLIQASKQVMGGNPGLPTPQCQKTVILMPENGNFKPKTVILKVENGNQNGNFFTSLFEHCYYLQVQIIIKNTSKTIKKRIIHC